MADNIGDHMKADHEIQVGRVVLIYTVTLIAWTGIELMLKPALLSSFTPTKLKLGSMDRFLCFESLLLFVIKKIHLT